MQRHAYHFDKYEGLVVLSGADLRGGLRGQRLRLSPAPALFPTRLASPREPLAELATTEGDFRLATSVGGVLTGRGADVILIDDPLKPIDAMSQSRRTAANDWLDSTLYSRLNDKQKGAIVIAMQRLHEDDLADHVLSQGGWHLLSFPAIAEDDEAHAIETPRGPWTFRRSAGEALDPAREPLATLERIRSTIGESNFAAQYQQTPAPLGGGMIKTAWFRRYRPNETPGAVGRNPREHADRARGQEVEWQGREARGPLSGDRGSLPARRPRCGDGRDQRERVAPHRSHPRGPGGAEASNDPDRLRQAGRASRRQAADSDPSSATAKARISALAVSLT
jgi:hypothetical protein